MADSFKKGVSTHAVIKYALLQIPALALLILALFIVRVWIDIPQWILWGIIILWVLKDVVLFPFVWRSYDTNRPGDPFSMVDTTGVAEDRLAPSGYARVRGELWKVELKKGSPLVEKGESIKVCGIQGLTLIVQKEQD